MTSNPTVLMIAYYFPPMGGVGVQRTLKFVKYLPEYGWLPHVLTAQPPKGGLRDKGLLKEIGPETLITRTAALLPSQRLPWRVREFISRWLLTVDEQVGWLPFAIRAGQRIIKENRVKVIYSTSAPYTAHLIARNLHNSSHIPWVADFRDPWVGNSNLHFPTPLHRKMVTHMEQQVIRDANQILVISPPMSQSICARNPGIQPSKITWLPNGFDAQDFSAAQPIKRDKDRFQLVYTGSFYTQGRTARAILEAVQAVTVSGQIPSQHLCIQMVGNIGKFTQKWISELKLDEIVETPGYVSHEQSTGYLLAADALLLIIGDSADSAGVYTGKIFEYLAAGKPILCLANTGVAADLIRNAGAGMIVPPDDVPQISQQLVSLYQLWQDGRLSIDPDQEFIQTFERRRLTGQLANIFNDLTGKTV
jgi:glycosyltransferase involved in cell wall biosynthesis